MRHTAKKQETREHTIRNVISVKVVAACKLYKDIYLVYTLMGLEINGSGSGFRELG